MAEEGIIEGPDVSRLEMRKDLRVFAKPCRFGTGCPQGQLGQVNHRDDPDRSVAAMLRR